MDVVGSLFRYSHILERPAVQAPSRGGTNFPCSARSLRPPSVTDTFFNSLVILIVVKICDGLWKLGMFMCFGNVCNRV